MPAQLTKKRLKIVCNLLSFLIPVVILFLVFLSHNIFWRSDRTVLASDGFHQYVIFAQTLRNILHGSDSIFYTFTSGLGLNFYALISYYLGSFLSPLVYFFNLTSMPDALYLFTLIKIGLIGLSTHFSLGKLYPKVNRLLVLVLSTSYALMSFSISQIEINMWLDVFILIPLIILGLNCLMLDRRGVLYYVTLTVLFIQNYYFGFMTAIFLSLYFLVKLTQDLQWKVVKRKFFDFTIVSILATLSSSIMLLPTYLDLSTHGEKFTSFTKIVSENTWYLDIFAKNIVGSYDTTKFGSIPMIYVGLLPLILALLYFTIASIDWKIRLAHALLLVFIIASFYLQPLDLLWQGMHAPNMFLHRYAWVFSTVIILLAGETLSHIKQIKLTTAGFVLTFIGVGFVLTFLFKEKYDFLSDAQFVLTFIFLLAYAILLVSQKQGYLPSKLVLIFTLVFSLSEISLNTYYQISSLNGEWFFPTREGYEKDLVDIDKLVNYTKTQNSFFYRTERLLAQTGNDSMKYNYNGISQFSSIRNTSSSSVLDRLGFKSTGTNLNLRYQNNTILMDSLFAIKYNIADGPVNKYGFSLVETSGETQLYENQFAAQLALLTKGVYKDVDFTVNTLDNQTKLINQITGLSEHYFNRLASKLISGGNQFGNRVTVDSNDLSETSVSYQVELLHDGQIYVSVPNINFTNDKIKEVEISVNGHAARYTTDNAYSFFNLGYFTVGEKLNVVLTFPDNSQVSFDSPNFYELNAESYQKAMKEIAKRDVKVTTNKNTVLIDYQTDDDSSLFLTLPYDEGWSASGNGKALKISKAQSGFMKVDVKAGSGQVILTYLPVGLTLGMKLSIIGVVLFIGYALRISYLRKKSKL